MRVSKCCEGKKASAPLTLSWAQMVAAEGVYRPIDTSAADCGRRFVVIRFGDKVTTLLYMAGCLFPPVAEWRSYKFVKTNETVCFGLKDDGGQENSPN